MDTSGLVSDYPGACYVKPRAVVAVRNLCLRGTQRLAGRQKPCMTAGTPKPTLYVPLQTREHAWAGMSGMLHFGGARGAFTSRGAEP